MLITGLWSCASDDPLPVVTVIGDSLNDVGALGFKATIQDSANPKGYPLWTQIVANSYGADGSAQCAYYISDKAGGFTTSTNAACTNFGISGARIVAGASKGSSSPLNVGMQMQARASRGSFNSSELLLVNGGGNDIADLVGLYLGAAGGGQGLAAFQQFLNQQVDSATLSSLLAQPTGPALAAGVYMQKLAETFHSQVSSQLLDKGAQRVLILNVPDITLTPRFKAVLIGVTAQAGAPAALQLQGAIRQWVAAFNQQLSIKAAADPRLLVVDFNASFSDVVQNFSSSKYALTNASDAACPVTGVADGLPVYDFPSCTSQALDSIQGKSVGWWKTYLFSDGFHPSPRGHEIMAQTVREGMVSKGWLPR